MRGRIESWVVAIALSALTTLFCGCSPGDYARRADADAYGTLQNAQQTMLGDADRINVAYNPVHSRVDPTQPIVLDGKEIPLFPEGDPTVVTMDEALKIAFRNSRRFQNRKEQLYTAALALANARRGWTHPLLGGDVTGALTHQGVNDGTHSESGAAAVSPTLTQRFVNGGILTLGTSLELLSDLTGWSNTTVGSAMEAGFTQPLLQNAWRGLAYEDQYRRERDFLFRVFDYERFTQQFAVDIVSDYYNVLQERDRVETEKNNIARLQRTFEMIKVLVRGGQRARWEQDQAEQRVVTAKIRLEEQQQRFQDSLDRYKITLGLPIEARVTINYPQALEQLNEAGPQDVPVEEMQAILIAMTTRPDVLTERASLRDAERDVEIAADRFLPELDLAVGLSAASSSERKFWRYRFNDYQRNAALDLDYPLDQTNNRDNYRLALLAHDRAIREYQEFEDTVALEVRAAYRELVRSRRSHELQLQNLKIATRRRILTELERKGGQVSARDVLEAEEDWQAARNGVVNSLVNYTVTRLRFLTSLGLIGVTDDSEMVELDDPSRFTRIKELYPYVVPELPKQPEE